MLPALPGSRTPASASEMTEVPSGLGCPSSLEVGKDARCAKPKEEDAGVTTADAASVTTRGLSSLWAALLVC